MIEGNHKDEGRKKVHNFETGMSSKPISLETQIEDVNAQKMEKLFKTQEILMVKEHVEGNTSLSVEIPGH